MTSLNNEKVKTAKQNNRHQKLIDEYQQIFQGAEKLGEFPLKLRTDKNQTPVDQPDKRLPYHLREKVLQKLNGMEANGIIEKVNQPSDWITPMVVKTKPNTDDIRVVDMRRGNTVIKGETYPIPTIEETIFKMSGTMCFSKL